MDLIREKRKLDEGGKEEKEKDIAIFRMHLERKRLKGGRGKKHWGRYNELSSSCT